jgi:hypothetical protein
VEPVQNACRPWAGSEPMQHDTSLLFWVGRLTSSAQRLGCVRAPGERGFIVWCTLPVSSRVQALVPRKVPIFKSIMQAVWADLCNWGFSGLREPLYDKELRRSFRVSAACRRRSFVIAWTAVGHRDLGGASGCPLQARIARAGALRQVVSWRRAGALSGVPCASTGGSL